MSLGSNPFTHPSTYSSLKVMSISAEPLIRSERCANTSSASFLGAWGGRRESLSGAFMIVRFPLDMGDTPVMASENNRSSSGITAFPAFFTGCGFSPEISGPGSALFFNCFRLSKAGLKGPSFRDGFCPFSPFFLKNLSVSQSY